MASFCTSELANSEVQDTTTSDTSPTDATQSQRVATFEELKSLTPSNTSWADLDDDDFWTGVNELHSSSSDNAESRASTDDSIIAVTASTDKLFLFEEEAEILQARRIAVQPLLYHSMTRKRSLFDDHLSNTDPRQCLGTPAVATPDGEASSPRQCKCTYASCDIHPSPDLLLELARTTYIRDVRDAVAVAAVSKQPIPSLKIPPQPVFLHTKAPVLALASTPEALLLQKKNCDSSRLPRTNSGDEQDAKDGEEGIVDDMFHGLTGEEREEAMAWAREWGP